MSKSKTSTLKLSPRGTFRSTGSSSIKPMSRPGRPQQTGALDGNVARRTGILSSGFRHAAKAVARPPDRRLGASARRI